MSDARALRTVELGDVEPARSRHAGRRSAVALTADAVVAGTASGDVLAHDRATLEERWRSATASEDAAVVAAEPFDGGVAVGERGPEGEVRLHDADSGAVRWRYATAADVGEPQKETRFFLPFVADVVAGEDRLFVAARRYERDGDSRAFTSVVYAFEASDAGSGPGRASSEERRRSSDVDVAWTYETDASPIGLDLRGDRVAVAYNRCPGDHQHGLVVLDAETGEQRLHWDPGTSGQRRVGDVSLLEDGLAVASHGDYRGYRLGNDGTERWRVDLATKVEIDGETLYAYPNHVHATAGSVVFLTGNTYSTDGRETESLHPDEHTAFGCAPDGKRVWSAPVGGFAGGIAADGDRVAVPGAQHFRTRDADVHGLRVFDGAAGPCAAFDAEGVVTAAALDGETVAAVEEPVVYHDEGRRRGAYRLSLRTIPR